MTFPKWAPEQAAQVERHHASVEAVPAAGFGLQNADSLVEDEDTETLLAFRGPGLAALLLRLLFTLNRVGVALCIVDGAKRPSQPARATPDSVRDALAAWIKLIHWVPVDVCI
jgi:hypothetical protein